MNALRSARRPVCPVGRAAPWRPGRTRCVDGWQRRRAVLALPRGAAAGGRRQRHRHTAPMRPRGRRRAPAPPLLPRRRPGADRRRRRPAPSTAPRRTGPRPSTSGQFTGATPPRRPPPAAGARCGAPRTTTATSRRPATLGADWRTGPAAARRGAAVAAALGRAAPAGTAATWSRDLTADRAGRARASSRTGSLAGALERPARRCSCVCHRIEIDQAARSIDVAGRPCDAGAQRRVRRRVDGAGRAVPEPTRPRLRAVLRRLPAGDRPRTSACRSTTELGPARRRGSPVAAQAPTGSWATGACAATCGSTTATLTGSLKGAGDDGPPGQHGRTE